MVCARSTDEEYFENHCKGSNPKNLILSRYVAFCMCVIFIILIQGAKRNFSTVMDDMELIKYGAMIYFLVVFTFGIGKYHFCFHFTKLNMNNSHVAFSFQC